MDSCSKKLTGELIKQLSAAKSNIEMSKHANQQCIIRLINSRDILYVLQNGEIIEDYPNDFPYPSCLMLGYLPNKTALHVCCAVGNGKIRIITAYYPTKDKWEDDMKTRKAV